MEHRCPFVQQEFIGNTAAALLPSPEVSPTQDRPSTAPGPELETAELSRTLKRGFIRQIFSDHRGCARLHASGGETVSSRIIGLLGAPRIYLTSISLS